ncbi:MAG: dynamin family protein [Spirochaetaceae bacterium]|jgi:hypothetical protein|nr:dynamin family protein [Spirochaetaceae bacterium]
MADEFDKDEKIEELEDALDKAQTALDAANTKLRRAERDKQDEFKQFRLVLDALSAKKTEHQYLNEFRRIVEHEYKPFAAEENSLPNEAEMFEKLKQIEFSVERMLNFHALSAQTIGAIGGGFSSGKSTFINSFFTEKTVQLATDINPSTAIPSYVVCESGAKITGYNSSGASFGIEPDVYESITHEAMKKLDFDLRKIIPYITVSCPMNKEFFENICLIDTPGYNAPSIGSAEKDEETAAASIANANFLVWLIGLDQTGTIQNSDLDFLKKDNMPFGKGGKEGRDLYIILNNKSGVRIKSDLEKIITSCETHLKDKALSYAGICAFNPLDPKRELYICRGMDFFDFLKSKNKPGANIDFIYEPLRDVLDAYRFYLEGDMVNAKAARTLMSDLKKAVFAALDGVKEGAVSARKQARALKTAVHTDILNRAGNPVPIPQKVDDIISSLEQQIGGSASFEIPEIIAENFSDIEKDLNKDAQLKGHLEKLEAVRKKFNACFMGLSREFCIKNWEPQPSIRRKHFCDKCGIKLDTFHKFCPKCGASTIMEERK